MDEARSLYESFNARNKSPEQVAETFVANREFFSLVKNSHTLVFGPRGSGKTTLFKMLTLRALSSWKDGRAEDIRQNLPFRAVYIPTDIHWSRQLLSTEQLVEQPELGHRISVAAVTTNVLLALLETMTERLRYDFRSEHTLDREASVCSELASAWLLPPIVPSTGGVQLALELRLSEIRRIAAQARDAIQLGHELPAFPQYFYLDYLAACGVACGAFDRQYSNERALRWCLCFDELELAPEWLQKRLYSELRSTDERFVFKLSTSPMPSQLEGTEAPQPHHDFQVIRLWAHNRSGQRDFSKRLLRSVLSQRLKRDVDPRKVFGSSMIASPRRGADADEYGEGSPTWQVIRELAEWDESLRVLLLKHGLSPDDPTSHDPRVRDQFLRKIKPIAFLRYTFQKAGDQGQSVGRSRKVATVYSGVDAIYDISEGNPRWLIGIVDDMLAAAPKTKDGVSDRIPDSVQARVLESASNNFCTLMKALPGAFRTVNHQKVDLYSLLNAIGKYFHERLTEDAFPLDPVGSFKVDEWIPRELIELLRLAAYQGAIIHVDPMEQGLDSALQGKRFRLSFVLAPAWQLPVRLYGSVRLSSCLWNDQELRSSISRFAPYQGKETPRGEQLRLRGLE